MKKHYENKTFYFDVPLEYSWKYYLKRALLPFFDWLYLLMLYVHRPPARAKKFTTAICCIFKDEGIFLKEWIEYHRIVGIEHFYMYNNFSSDHYQEILQPYVEQGLVTLMDWPVPQGQPASCEHWYKTFRHETQWISFVDLDEFICPSHETSAADWIKRFRNYPCVVMYWRMFGTAGRIKHDPDRLVTEQYTLSWDKLYSIGKIFYNTDYEIVTFYDQAIQHAPRTRMRFCGKGFAIPPINEFKYFLRWDIHRTGRRSSDDFTMQVNHYWCKAYLEFEAKTRKTDACFAVNPRSMGPTFTWHEKNTKTADFKIFRFMILLKRALGWIPGH